MDQKVSRAELRYRQCDRCNTWALMPLHGPDLCDGCRHNTKPDGCTQCGTHPIHAKGLCRLCYDRRRSPQTQGTITQEIGTDMEADIETAATDAANYCEQYPDASYTTVFDRFLRARGYTVTPHEPQ